MRNIKAGEQIFCFVIKIYNVHTFFQKSQLFFYISGEEILSHYDLEFHEAHPWYQEMWRTELEYDTPEGPYGHR